MTESSTKYASGSFVEYTNATDAGLGITKGYIEYLSSVETEASGASGTRGKEKTKVNWSDWVDMGGAAGTVMGLIKKPSGDKGKLTISMKNSTPHVMVPCAIHLPDTYFFCTASYGPTEPGDTCDIELDIGANHKLYTFSILITMIFCSSNGKTARGYFRLECDEGWTFNPGEMRVDGYGTTGAKFHNKDAGDDERNLLGFVEMRGNDGYPSFGVASMKVPTNSKGSSSTVGVTFTPTGEAVIPSDEIFHANWILFEPSMYGDPGTGCAEFGLMMWNHIRRTTAKDANTGTESTRSVGFVAGAIEAGVSLLTGALNLARKDNQEDHNLVLNIKNYTEHMMVISEVSNTNECTTDFPIIHPDSEGEITVGSRYYEGKDYGPVVVFVMTSDENKSIKVTVELINTTVTNQVAGQFRVLSLDVDGKKCTDEQGKHNSNQVLTASVYKSPKQDFGKPMFTMLGAPTSANDSNFTLAFAS